MSGNRYFLGIEKEGEILPIGTENNWPALYSREKAVNLLRRYDAWNHPQADELAVYKISENGGKPEKVLTN